MEAEFEGLKLKIPKTVYEPSEDSFMLAKGALEVKQGSKVLEVGCGSGIASICALKAKAEVLGVDISLDAVECAKENAAKNNFKGKFIQSNLFEKVPKGKFDVIMFNPPYLPTELKDKLNGPLNHAFDGGKDGRKVLDVFLDQFDNYLKKGGYLLLVQSDLNGPIKTRRKLKKMNYEVEVLFKESFFFETVFIYKAIKK